MKLNAGRLRDEPLRFTTPNDVVEIVEALVADRGGPVWERD
jgi:hypothetical protein